MPSYNIYFDKDFDDALGELVKTTGASDKADVIRLAVASYKFLKDQKRERNMTTVLRSADGTVEKPVELP